MELSTLKQKILENIDDRIILLKKDGVLEWIYGTKSFLDKLSKKNEDLFIKGLSNSKNKQCSGPFGETLIQEILLLNNIPCTKVKKYVKGTRTLPDLESSDTFYEVKTRTYKTTGSAGDKILATPYKYCNIYKNTGKKVIIVCLGYQEIEADKKFNLFKTDDINQKKMLEFYKEQFNVQYMKATDLLHMYLHSN
jgi:hypothetical protein